MQEWPSEITFYYEIKGSLKHFIDVIYSITEFKRKAFALCIKELSPTHPRSWKGDQG